MELPSSYAERAAAEGAMAAEPRAAAWIFTDFTMELIGRPLPEVPTQWQRMEGSR